MSEIRTRQRDPSRRLTVITVSYNSAAVLPELLDSLVPGLSGIDDVEVIVADNDSQDGSADLAASHPIRPKVIWMRRNAGYAAGINAAALNATPSSPLLILNPDIRLVTNSAALLMDALSDPRVGVAAPQIMDESGKRALSVRREPSLLTGWSDAILGSELAAKFHLGEVVGDTTLYQHGGDVEWVTGAILMISARVRQHLGEWDESFFLYSEEVDYLRRVREAGFSVRYVANAKAVHIGGAYQNNPRLSALMTSNRIRYFRRNHGAIGTLAFRLSIIAASIIRAPLGRGHRASLFAALRSSSLSSPMSVEITPPLPSSQT